MVDNFHAAWEFIAFSRLSEELSASSKHLQKRALAMLARLYSDSDST